MLFILALSDLFSAYFLIKGITHPLIVAFLWLHSIKGITSLMGSFASGYYFDWMGVTDVLAALLILLMTLPLVGVFFAKIAFYVGILMAIKGIYSMLWVFI
ncbi:MAG: hypothetical protein QXM68_03250 [Candidatus Aenigmatarchaeota archaeon]|nr:hypothetical protein [Candidatus Aenigmarchaeota archaeon]